MVSFVKNFGSENTINDLDVKIKKTSAGIGSVLLIKLQLFWVYIFEIGLKGQTIIQCHKIMDITINLSKFTS